jgi:protein-disulfide isomerase
MAQKKEKDNFAKFLVVGMIALVVIVGVIFTVINKNQNAFKGVIPKDAVASNGYGITFNKGAAHKIDLWEDFQCPICKEFETANGDFNTKLAQSGKVEVVYHMLSFIDTNLNKHGSHLSANAAACIDNEGKFLDFHKLLYANQPAEKGPDLFTNSYLINLAKQVGVSDSTFTNCVNSNKYSGWIDQITSDGDKVGITGTPTIYVDGKEIDTNAVNIMDPKSYQAYLASKGISL